MDEELNKKFNLPATTISEPKVPMKIDADSTGGEKDFEYVRRNLYEGIEIGSVALNELAQIAASSQNARAYEVLGIFMERYANINKDLFALHKQKKELHYDPTQGPASVTNNLNITTKDLSEMLSKRSEEKD